MEVSGQHHAPAALYPRGKDSRYPLDRTGWAPEPVWTQRLEEKSSVSVGDRTSVVKSVVRHYTEILLDVLFYHVIFTREDQWTSPSDKANGTVSYGFASIFLHSS
jgi:hypothetical protein